MLAKDNKEVNIRLQRVSSQNNNKINLKSKIPLPPKSNYQNNNKKENIISTRQKIKPIIPLSKEINSSNTNSQLTISTNITTQRKKTSFLHLNNQCNIDILKRKINFNRKEKLVRTRSGKKTSQSEKTSPCQNENLLHNKENINNLKNNDLNKIEFKGFGNSNFKIENKRSINDIKKEYLITMRNSENIQNIIINNGEKKIKILKEKYNKIFKEIRKENELQERINNINLGLYSNNIKNIELNKKNIAAFTNKEYKQLLTTENKLEYGNSILEEYFSKQEMTKNILLKHEITSKMRLKMIDWMIEVFNNLNSEDITFFTAVNIMDRFFIESKNKFKPDDLHLIGICSIFISSKFNEIHPIKLSFLIENISHNKFNKEQILKMEENIMFSLKFDILRPYSLNFAEYFFEELFSFFENNFNIRNIYLEKYLRDFIENINVKISLDKFYFDKCESIKKYSEKMKNFLWLIIIYLLKMCCHDYELIQEKPSLIAASSILVGMKICESINNQNYINELFMNNLSNISKENEYNLLSCSTKILFKAQNFKKEYKEINNLYNSHFEIINKFIK